MDFKNINISFVDNELDTHISNNRSLIVSLKNLQKNQYNNRELWQFKYLTLLIDKIGQADSESNILTCKFDVLIEYKQEFEDEIDLIKKECKVKKKKCNCTRCKENRKKVTFSNQVQNILKYQHDKLRGYYSNTGIKTCYVCNAQYAVMAKDEKKGRNINSKIINQERDKAKFELDHILPKSIFPCFSISLYNLLPICPPCNKIKTNNEIDVSNILTKVKYKITIKSLQQYYKGEGQLEIEVLDETNENANKQLSRVFDLKGIYRNHIDVIEELIERKIKYTDKYKEMLARSFPGIVGTEKNIDDRLIIGTYGKEEGFLKRPLSKFIHDINDQLDSFTGYYNKIK
ncbi:HNH endonuclease signature motif containing protein [Myroides odoratimimus]|uniref:HNH endonuclease signature motif containing protein n=1 Tax=Myroides odoratimimus TaxID=76832 RepID=UPI0031018990